MSDAARAKRRGRRERRAEARRRRWQAVALLLVLALIGVGGRWRYTHQAQDPEALYARAQGAFERREYSAAQVDLRALLASDGDNAEARLLLGRTYLETGNAEGALKEFGKAREIGLEDQTVALGSARAQLMLGRLDEAGGQIALHAVEGSVDWQLLSAALAFARGRLDEARQGYAALVAAHPDLREARLGLARVELARGKADAARSEVDALLQADGRDGGLWLLKGSVELLAKANDAARAAFERALSLSPGSTLATLGIAEALLGGGDARAAAERLDSLGPALADDPRVNLLRARVAEARRDPEHALLALNKVLQVLPDERESLAMAARINFTLGAYARAEAFTVQLLRLEPDDAAARRMLGAIRLASGRLDGLTALVGADGEPLTDTRDPAALALLGAAYLKHGKYQDAEAKFDRAVALAPDSAPLRTAAALGKLSAGNAAQAVAELRAVIASQPDFSQARVLLALALLSQKRPDEARAVAQAFVDAAPASALAHNLLGYVREAGGDRRGAGEAYEAALAADADFHFARLNLARLAVLAGDTAAGARRFDEVLARDAHNPMALLGLAALALRDGNETRAEEFWSRAREHNPEAVEPRVLLARQFRRQGSITRAEAPIREAWKLAPFSPLVQAEYADVMLALGDDAAALEAVRAMLARDPEDIGALERSAIAAGHMNDEAGMVAALRRLVEIRPDHAGAQTMLAQVAIRHGDYAEAERIAIALQGASGGAAAGFELAGDVATARGRGAEARQAYARAVELEPRAARLVKLEQAERAAGIASERVATWLRDHPDDMDALLAHATNLQAQGQAASAIAAYERVVASNPAQPVALNNLAWMYFEADDGRAVETGRRAYELAPREPAIVDTYGWVLFRGGQREQGLELLKRALELAPDNADIACHLATALADSGQQDEARRRVRALLDRHANFTLRGEAEALARRLGGG